MRAPSPLKARQELGENGNENDHDSVENRLAAGMGGRLHSEDRACDVNPVNGDG